ncbi:MAG: DUF1080 domain-containing protein [Candidatus Latescibacteria bacterium]|nr:DUF1080 domain-containing protein [Candidatus Latescibacterota bacterium]
MTETIKLFNGRDLTGWEDHKNPHLWTVENDMIVCTSEAGKMSNLSTQAQYSDFELTFEYNADAKVNSGVFLRVSDLNDEVHTGLEIQILDTYGKEPPLGKGDNGALYDMIEASTNPLKPAGEWNRMRLRCEGPRVEVELNGVQVVEADLDLFDTPGVNLDGTNNKFKYAWKTMPRTGHIGLQTHAGMGGLSDVKIRFRNLVVQTL